MGMRPEELLKLDAKQVMHLGEDDAEYLFAVLRWGLFGGGVIAVLCPRCQEDQHYFLDGKHKRYKCIGCDHQFTTRTGTVFASSKLTDKQCAAAYLAVIEYVYPPKSKKLITARELSEIIGVNIKSAYVLREKILATAASDGDPLHNVPSAYTGYWQGRPFYSTKKVT